MLALGTLAAGTAHELNTPLTTMGLLLDDWRDGHAPDDEDLALMRAQLAHCRDHVRTLADLARRGDAGEAVPRDADTLLRDCVDRWRLLRPSVAVSLDAGAAGHAVRVDATLPQALIHLFNNAADANARRGTDTPIEIASRIVEGRLHVEVRDRGDGPDTLAAFARAERGTHNLGVGLMITNASIERAGGNVRQFARDGGGCITEIALPLANDDVAPRHERRLLACCSSTTTRRSARCWRAGCSARASPATSPTTRRLRCGRLDASPPDARPQRILLDLRLGADNGLALIQALRERCPDARIVLATGYASIATAVDAMRRGAWHYLPKPFDLDSLLRSFGDAPDAAPADIVGSATDAAPARAGNTCSACWPSATATCPQRRGCSASTGARCSAGSRSGRCASAAEAARYSMPL